MTAIGLTIPIAAFMITAISQNAGHADPNVFTESSHCGMDLLFPVTHPHPALSCLASYE